MSARGRETLGRKSLAPAARNALEVCYGSTAVDPQLAREWRRPVASGLMHRSKKALFDYFVGASEQQGRQLQAELPVQFFGSRQTQIPLSAAS